MTTETNRAFSNRIFKKENLRTAHLTAYTHTRNGYRFHISQSRNEIFKVSQQKKHDKGFAFTGKSMPMDAWAVGNLKVLDPAVFF